MTPHDRTQNLEDSAFHYVPEVLNVYKRNKNKIVEIFFVHCAQKMNIERKCKFFVSLEGKLPSIIHLR